MAELKQSRWVKVHEKGQANFEAQDNIMDILIGEKRCQADVTYTVRSHKKAAFWLDKYLEAAGAADVLHEIAAQIQTALESKEDVELNNEKWSLQIEKMDVKNFRVQLVWQPDEPVTKKQPAKRTKKVRKVEDDREPFSVPKKYMNRVRDAYQKDGEFRIELKNGWLNDGSDIIVESSSKEAVKVIKSCTKAKKA